VADDGSTDGTAEVAAAYKPHVSYLWQPNRGPAAARNLGVKASSGQFIAFLDSDDLWHPDKLARQMSRFERRPELELCVSHIQNFLTPELCEGVLNLEDRLQGQAVPGYMSHTILARKTLFERVGGFASDLRHSDDTEWFLRARENGVIMEMLPDVLTYRRLHLSNLSRQEASASQEEYLQLIKASLDRRRMKGIPEKCDPS
jgi:glycosyltransferase involved in cell wall biosynthesis